jgi:hypothetical protein
MALKIADISTDAGRGKLLKKLLAQIPDVLTEAIDACSAPRHKKDAREEYGKMLRRKWFGSKRGTVRHTFRDILQHIKSHEVLIHTNGKYSEGAHAYTPDDQDINIYLCTAFFSDTVEGQVATIIHELTHLVRKTEDYEPPSLSAEDDFRLVTTKDITSVTREEVITEKKARFEGFSKDINAASSAYNFEYFIQDLLDEVAILDDSLAPVR